MPSELNLTEVLCALSLATDLANGNALETALRTSVIAVELASAEGLGEPARGDVFFGALLRYIGCTAYAPEEAAMAGDDLAFKQTYAAIDPARPVQVLTATAARLKPRSALRVALSPRASLDRLASASCEVGQRLSLRLGMTAEVATSLEQLHERWDGKGAPRRLAGEAISTTARVVQVAVVAELQHRLGGAKAAVEEVRRRSGRQLDPRWAKAFVAHGPAILSEVDSVPAWEAALERAPKKGPAPTLDALAETFASFVDLKSAYLLGHSSGVARLAVEAGRTAGLDATATTLLSHAGLLHDLGRVGVPTNIWDKRGPLNPVEQDRVRAHAHDTARILNRSPLLAPIAAVAEAHHERLDGSGYPRRAAASQLGLSARLLAAADHYQALTSARPHRPAFAPERARQLLDAEASAGRLDARAVEAVLVAAGVRRASAPSRGPAGLTDREVQVLARLARGETNKEIAVRFGLSPRTVQHHSIHIYAKLGISTRAAAALFAVEHGLLEDAPTGAP